jgi:hypothetical protein
MARPCLACNTCFANGSSLHVSETFSNSIQPPFTLKIVILFLNKSFFHWFACMLRVLEGHSRVQKLFLAGITNRLVLQDIHLRNFFKVLRWYMYCLFIGLDMSIEYDPSCWLIVDSSNLRKKKLKFHENEQFLV